MEHCATALSHSTSAQWRLEGDRQSCFDTISHAWLLTPIPMEKALLTTGLQAGDMDQSVLYETAEGTPQGGLLSPVLAHRTLDGLETRRRQKDPQAGSRAVHGKKKQGNLVRYADDFMMTGHSKEVRETDVQPLIVACLQERGLERSEAKTRRTHIEDGCDFLGQHARKDNGQFLTRPSKTTVHTCLASIRQVIRGNTHATAYGLIALLNPTRRRWANFHRHAAAKETFVHGDTAMFKALWRWAKRRHPKKDTRWGADRYFERTVKRNWHFFGTAKDKDGKSMTHGLCHASATPGTRHTTMKGACNPDDPAWDISLEERLGVQMEKTLRGRRTLAHLWKEHGGNCPVCTPPITQVTGWHHHHIVYKTMGGTDGMSHRVLMHPHCHRHVHAKGLTVSKPRPVTAVSHAQPGALFHA